MSFAEYNIMTGILYKYKDKLLIKIVYKFKIVSSLQFTLLNVLVILTIFDYSEIHIHKIKFLSCTCGVGFVNIHATLKMPYVILIIIQMLILLIISIFILEYFQIVSRL